MTHTYAIVLVSPATYGEIRERLLKAGYEHAFDHDVGRAEVIDMHGLALVALEEPAGAPASQPDPSPPEPDASAPTPVDTTLYLESMIATGTGELRVEMRSAVIPILADHLARIMKSSGAENYLAFEINHDEMGPLMLRIQRRFGETPEQQARERKATIEALSLVIGQRDVALAQLLAQVSMLTDDRKLLWEALNDIWSARVPGVPDGCTIDADHFMAFARQHAYSAMKKVAG